MPQYTHRTLVKASLQKVAAFHNDPRALKILTPPGLFVQFVQVEPLHENSKTDFILWFGPLPVRWVAIHSNVGPDGFTDTQVSGPFQYWRHRHSFLPQSEHRTEIVDEVTYEWRRHFIWGMVGRFMAVSLPILFAYRSWITRRRIEFAEVKEASFRPEFTRNEMLPRGKNVD